MFDGGQLDSRSRSRSPLSLTLAQLWEVGREQALGRISEQDNVEADES
jgi:hypothetical protein